MGYRDEEEGLRIRVDELEGELAEANDTIARLRGEGATEVASDAGSHDWVTGGPKGLHLERELPFEVSEEGFEAIAEVANQRLPGGSVSLIGRTLTHRHGEYELRVTRGAGKTSVRVLGTYQGARLLLALAGMGAGVLGGGFVGGIAEAIGFGGAVVLPLFVLGGLLGFMGLRYLLKTNHAKGRATVTGVFETVCDLVKEHRIEPPKTRVAIADDAAVEREALATEEAEAEAPVVQRASSSAS